ncbi:MAG TPA: NAD-dependent epimerase/dehydratase family protein [Mucilaginibacter sp.]
MQQSNKKIFILGSEGFIGNHCINYFLRKGYQVFGCDLLDIQNPAYTYFKISRFDPEFYKYFDFIKFDVCINAAGSGSVPLSFSHPYNDFEANSIDIFKILEAIKNYNPDCRYLNISSAAVYGAPQKLPIDEQSKIAPLSPYGWHKYLSELICKEYHALYKIKTCSVRPFSVYGPGLKKQLFWDIYQKCRQSQKVELFGTGDESRDFIYVDDLIAAFNLIIEKDCFNGITINIATGIETSIKHAAELLCGHIDPNIKISFNNQAREGDPLNWRADISTLSSLGFKSQTTIETGLYNYNEWLKEKK